MAGMRKNIEKLNEDADAREKSFNELLVFYTNKNPFLLQRRLYGRYRDG